MIVGSIELHPVPDAVGLLAPYSSVYPDVPDDAWDPYRALYPELFAVAKVKGTIKPTYDPNKKP